MNVNNVGGYISRSYNALAGTTATVEYLVVAGGSRRAGGTYIYMAFAETPFKYSCAR